MTHRVLVVEDEPAIAEMIKISLEINGYDISLAGHVAAAKSVIANEKIDVALVDWMLPGASGLELVRHLRKSETTKNLPVIMLTAKTEEHEITSGLDAGADDYVTKPFSPRELRSRIKALLRRSGGLTSQVISCGELVCDSSAHRICAGDRELDLSHTEFKLLQFLMSRPEHVFSRSQLLDHVWGTGTFIDERTIDVHVLRLRKNLKPCSLDHMIQTIRGAGYRLTASQAAS